MKRYEHPSCNIRIIFDKRHEYLDEICKKEFSKYELPRLPEKFYWTLKIILLNLQLYESIAIHLKDDWYIKNSIKKFSKRRVRHIITFLTKDKYITIKKGKKGKSTSIITATEKLKILFKNKKKQTSYEINTKNINEIEIGKICHLCGDTKKLESSTETLIRDITKNVYPNLNPRKYINDAFYNIVFLNEFLCNVKLSTSIVLNKPIISNAFFTRVFNKEYTSRIVQRGGQSYQYVKKEDRQFLLIDKKKCCEVDFSGMHPNLIYCKEEKQNPFADIYTPVLNSLNLNPDDELLREAVKKLLFICINFKEKRGYGYIFKDNYPTLLDYVFSQNTTLKQIRDAILTVHSPLENYLNTGIGKELMLIECDILSKSLEKLRKKGVIGLPLHDAIICKQSDKFIVKKIMKDTFKEHTGFKCYIKIKDYKYKK